MESGGRGGGGSGGAAVPEPCSKGWLLVRGTYVFSLLLL